MEKNKLKSYMLLISFSIGLVLMVVHFRDILHGIGYLAKLLTPLFIGTLLAFALNRPYEWFYKWFQKKCKLKKKNAKIIAVITVYVLTLGALALIAGMVIPELGRNIKTFAENIDEYLFTIQSSINNTFEDLKLEPVDLTYFIESIDQYLGSFSDAAGKILPKLMKATSSVLSGIVTAFVALILSVYILTGKRRLLMQIKRTLHAYLPERLYHIVDELYQTISQVFGDYIAGQCKEAVILGSLCFIGMMILRLDYAGLISVIIAITALVPIVGAYLGGTVAVLLLLLVSPGKAFVFLIFLLILQQVEGNLIYPRVVGRKIGLPGMWVILSITIWGRIFGAWGMLLGVPATTILYQLLKENVRKRELR